MGGGVFRERPLSEGPTMCVAGMGGYWDTMMVEDGGRTWGHYNNRLNSWGGVWFLVASMGGYWD